MFDPVIKGIALGLIIALMIGPVFFFIIHTSIRNGFTAAVVSALGVMLSDALMISIAYFGSSFLLYLNKHLHTASIIGGLVILSYGFVLAFRERRVSGESLEDVRFRGSYAIFLAKGFMLNAVNPSVLLFWIVVAGTVPAREAFSPQETLLFYGCTLATVLLTDVIKGYLASRLKAIVTTRFLLWMNRIAGTALMLYGASMIVRLFLD